MTALADVARRAGVSLATASRVLSGAGPASEKTRACVRAAAAELGYATHPVARMLARGSGTRMVLAVRDARPGMWACGCPATRPSLSLVLVPEIRPYRPSDRDAVYDICVRTADAGNDARGQFSTDDLWGDLFAGPYVHLEPGLAFVVADADRPVGYVVGTADTATFVKRYAAEWIPLLGDRYPVPPPSPRTPEQDMVDLHHHPERMLVPGLEGFPAHLHIDLLPPYQGRGLGRRLIDRFAAAVDAPGVHVAMLTSNVRARGFYDRLGFEVLPVPDPGPLTYLGLRLTR